MSKKIIQSLSACADYVADKIKSNSISLDAYVTTDSILQQRQGRQLAENLPPTPASLTRYKSGDVLIANIRPYLKKIWRADREGGCSQDVLVFRARTTEESKYLYALLLQDSFYDYVMLAPRGSKMPRGDEEHIMRFPVVRLDRNQRIEIGNFVSALDDKIALNRKKIEKLEALAKTIYDYWFVQFDFPDANGRPYKSSGGKMVYNPILKREIPEWWDIKRLGECLAPIPKTNRVPTNGYLKKGAIPIIDQEVGSYIVGYTNDEDACLKLGSCIVFGDHSCSVKYVNFDFARGADGTQVINSRIPHVLDNFQIYFFLKEFKFEAGYKRHFYDLKQRYISVSNDADLVARFHSMSHDIFLLIKELTSESFRLALLRDFILPLLMNGQVEVGE